jgi:hypothetical protein
LRKGPLAGAATPRERERQIAPKKARHFSLKITAIAFAAEALLQVGDDINNPPMPSLYEQKTALPSDFYIAADKDTGSTTLLSTLGEPMMGAANKDKAFSYVRLSKIEGEQISNGTQALWSYGFVRYRDVFKRRFELRFCHRYEPKLMPIGGGFVVAGPPEFNRLSIYKG